MSLRKTLLLAALTYIGINLLLITLHLASSYRQTMGSFSVLADAYLDSSFDMYRSELTGNLLLDDRPLLEAFMTEMTRTRGISARLSGKTQGDFGVPADGETYQKTFPLSFGADNLGELTLYYRVPGATLTSYAGVVTTMLLQLLLSGLGFFLVYALLIRRVLAPIRSLEEATRATDDRPFVIDEGASEEIGNLATAFQAMRARLTESARFEAIARTSQMLAHDVRTPFSMLSSVLQTIRSSRDPATIVELAHTYSPQVDQAMRSVDAMIKDIIEVGSRSKPVLEPACVEVLIKDVLSAVLRTSDDLRLSLSYSWGHRHRLMVDPQKIGRVFANILWNAAEVTCFASERLWIKTWEEGDAGGEGDEWDERRDVSRSRAMRLVIGNSGSFVPEANLGRIFEAFFTSGKRGGTGLGLAVARQIVAAHGGEIWCESSEDRGTEFHMRLPIDASTTYEPHLPLPASASAFRVPAEPASVAPELAGAPRAHPDQRRPVVLVIDDETLYHGVLSAQIASSTACGACEIATALSGEDGIRQARTKRPDIIIVDLDLGPSRMDGFAVVERLRKDGVKARICIHSNRKGEELSRRSAEAGADFFMPKPMAEGDLRQLFAAPDCSRHFVVVDDNAFMRMQWEDLEELGPALGFASPEAMLAASAKDERIVANASCFILDHYFDTASNLNGLDLAQQLRNKGYDGPIFLSSDGEFPAESLAPARVIKIPKVARQALPFILPVLPAPNG